MNDDRERERQRLQERYAGMTDEELLLVADDLGGLTEVAHEAMTVELARRKLQAPEAKSVVSDELEVRDVVTVAKFRDLAPALMAKAALESAGIETFLLNDNMVRLDWFISNYLGGVQLQVARDDAEEAQKVLAEPIPQEFEVEGVGEFKQPECPACHSIDVMYITANPVTGSSDQWSCAACGHKWDVEAEEASASV